MHDATRELLLAVRVGEVGRIATARGNWVEKGCPDVDLTGIQSSRFFGAALNQARLRAGLSLRELAARIGGRYQRIFRLENGSLPRAHEWERLRKELGLSGEEAHHMQQLMGMEPKTTAKAA